MTRAMECFLDTLYRGYDARLVFSSMARSKLNSQSLAFEQGAVKRLKDLNRIQCIFTIQGARSLRSAGATRGEGERQVKLMP